MPPPIPPFDRTIALACTMRTLRGRWLHLRCGCGAADARPVKVMLGQDASMGGRTLADVVVHLRCGRCGARPIAVHLTETGHGPPPVSGDVKPGWHLQLHGPVPTPSAPTYRTGAVPSGRH